MRLSSRVGLAILLLMPSAAFAGKPNWVRHATGFAGQCQSGCPTLHIVAPDKTTAVEVLYQEGGAYLRVSQGGKPAREIHDVFTSSRNDLLWAPDSKAFLVDAGEGMTSPGFVQVYMLDDAQLRSLDVTHRAGEDMVKSFPPCQALFVDPAACRKIEANPGYNMTAITWTKDSSALVVLAQVPCTSNFGGISCQSMGYEVEVPSGNILKRIPPAEFKKEYQKFMEQKYEIPEPPQYVAPLQGR
ncbi:MAG TPA: hypothetical protein VGG15_03390 [Terriglobales bacterium]